MAVTAPIYGHQKRAFTMTCDVYRPSFTVSSGRNEIRGKELVAEDVPCRIDSKSESSKVIEGANRANVDQMDTTDVLRLPEVLDDGDPLQIGDGWAVRITAGAGGEDGGWFFIQGEGKNLSFRARERTYLVARGTQPPIYAAPTP